MKLKKIVAAALIGSSLLISAQAATAAASLPKSYLETKDLGDKRADAFNLPLGDFYMGYMSKHNDFDWFKWTNKTNQVVMVDPWLYSPTDKHGTMMNIYLPGYYPDEVYELWVNGFQRGHYHHFEDPLIKFGSGFAVKPGHSIYVRINPGGFPQETSTTKNYVFWFHEVKPSA